MFWTQKWKDPDPRDQIITDPSGSGKEFRKYISRIKHLDMEVGTLLLGAEPLQEVLAGGHLLRGHAVGEEADLLLAGALQEPLAHRPLLRVVEVGAGPLVLLRALPELVEEHAVLLAAVLVLQDDVDAPVLGLKKN